MKTFLASVLAIMMTLSLTACGETQTPTPTTENEPIVDEKIVPLELPTEFEISTGVYKCETDFAAGAYTVSINSKDDWIDYIVFDSVDEYVSYNNAGAYTVGEEVIAIEQNALSYTSIQDEEIGYLELKEGNVLKFEGDGCTLKPVSFDEGILYTGTYFIGENFKEGSYRVTNKDEWGTEFKIFESNEIYRTYFSTHRGTVGEENDALEQFMKAYSYISDQENDIISLEDGQVLVIDGVASFEIF